MQPKSCKTPPHSLSRHRKSFLKPRTASSSESTSSWRAVSASSRFLSKKIPQNAQERQCTECNAGNAYSVIIREHLLVEGRLGLIAVQEKKVSDTAETPQAKRLSTPRDVSPQDEIASGSAVPAARSQLQIYQSFRHTLGSRPEVRAITIQDDSLSLCFKKLVRRLNNSDLLASLYQYPDWTNYYGLDIILQDVLQFCGQVDSAPYPTHSDVVSARDSLS
ncbi:hypothetical protein BDZ89DRAFT_1257067 [Hymenopellis radicata]|nr:hypothetical protein BDZ89DRAFT_1257067 [Hymenopellis radicata]